MCTPLPFSIASWRESAFSSECPTRAGADWFHFALALVSYPGFFSASVVRMKKLFPLPTGVIPFPQATSPGVLVAAFRRVLSAPLCVCLCEKETLLIQVVMVDLPHLELQKAEDDVILIPGTREEFGSGR